MFLKQQNINPLSILHYFLFAIKGVGFTVWLDIITLFFTEKIYYRNWIERICSAYAPDLCYYHSLVALARFQSIFYSCRFVFGRTIPLTRTYKNYIFNPCLWNFLYYFSQIQLTPAGGLRAYNISMLLNEQQNIYHNF